MNIIFDLNQHLYKLSKFSIYSDCPLFVPYTITKSLSVRGGKLCLSSTVILMHYEIAPQKVS